MFLLTLDVASEGEAKEFIRHDPQVVLEQELFFRAHKNLNGMYDGAIDGLFGEKTALAIDLFKIKNGLLVGDYFDEETLIELGIN